MTTRSSGLANSSQYAWLASALMCWRTCCGVARQARRRAPPDAARRARRDRRSAGPWRRPRSRGRPAECTTMSGRTRCRSLLDRHLLDEVAMLGEPGQLDHALQRQLAPSPAHVRGAQGGHQGSASRAGDRRCSRPGCESCCSQRAVGALAPDSMLLALRPRTRPAPPAGAAPARRWRPRAARAAQSARVRKRGPALARASALSALNVWVEAKAGLVEQRALLVEASRSATRRVSACVRALRARHPSARAHVAASRAPAGRAARPARPIQRLAARPAGSAAPRGATRRAHALAPGCAPPPSRATTTQQQAQEQQAARSSIGPASRDPAPVATHLAQAARRHTRRARGGRGSRPTCACGRGRSRT